MTDIPLPNMRMVRLNLDNIPVAELPDGFSIVDYRPGDATAWTEIHHLTYVGDPVQITPDLHLRMFGTDDEVLSERQLFIKTRDGRKIATATAWFKDDYHGERYGQVHWVAVVPACQGKGLSKPLLRAVLLRMKTLGHDKAMLITQTTRITAIRLYEQFGFVPDTRDGEPQKSKA